mmetsp:Transcript_14326/g.44501  ORF Transcript_14326/g.44501 Transcript_14326/m.44501 type:complete len:204 (-) Transcript_14326:1115-1726(-)
MQLCLHRVCQRRNSHCVAPRLVWLDRGSVRRGAGHIVVPRSRPPLPGAKRSGPDADGECDRVAHERRGDHDVSAAGARPPPRSERINDAAGPAAVAATAAIPAVGVNVRYQSTNTAAIGRADPGACGWLPYLVIHAGDAGRVTASERRRRGGERRPRRAGRGRLFSPAADPGRGVGNRGGRLRRPAARQRVQAHVERARAGGD